MTPSCRATARLKGTKAALRARAATMTRIAGRAELMTVRPPLAWPPVTRDTGRRRLRSDARGNGAQGRGRVRQGPADARPRGCGASPGWRRLALRNRQGEQEAPGRLPQAGRLFPPRG